MAALFNRRFNALLAIMCLHGIAIAAVIPLFPAYIEGHLRLDHAAVFSANLRFLFFLLGGLSAIPAGALCDSFGRKATVVIGITGSISAGLLFVTGHPAALCLLCIHAGLTTGVLATAAQSYLLGAVEPNQVGIGAALYFIAFNLGNALGSRLSGVLAKWHGYFVMGEVLTAAGVLACAGAMLALPSLPRVTLSRAEVWNIAGYRRLLGRGDVWWLIGIRFLPTCYWGAIIFTVPLLLSRLTHYDPRVPANYQVVCLLVAMACQFATGRWCDRCGRRAPLLAAGLLVALSALLLVFSTQSLVALYAFGVMAAGAAWSVSTTIPGIINDIAGAGEKGRVTSLAHVAWSVGMAAGTWGAGRLVDVSPELIFAISAALCAGAVVCGVRLTWRRA